MGTRMAIAAAQAMVAAQRHGILPGRRDAATARRDSRRRGHAAAGHTVLRLHSRCGADSACGQAMAEHHRAADNLVWSAFSQIEMGGRTHQAEGSLSKHVRVHQCRAGAA